MDEVDLNHPVFEIGDADARYEDHFECVATVDGGCTFPIEEPKGRDSYGPTGEDLSFHLTPEQFRQFAAWVAVWSGPNPPA